MSLFVQEYLEGAWVDLGTATKCWHDFKTGRLERVTCEDNTVQVNVCVNGMNKKRVLDMSLVLVYIRAANRWQNNFNKKAVYRVVDAEGVSVDVKKMRN